MRWLNWVIHLYERQYVAILSILTLFTIAAVFIATTLEMDADLSGLLPESAPSVHGLNQLEQAYGGQIGRLTVVLSGDSPQNHRQAADMLSEVYPYIDGVQRIEVTKPLDYFQRYRLLYVDRQDLELIEDRVQRRIRWEQQQANPLFVDLTGMGPPGVDLSDIEEKYQAIGTDKYFISSDASQLLLFIYPDFPASDIEKSKTLVSQVERITTDKLKRSFPEMTFALTGRYKKRVEQQAIVGQDLRMATSLAMILLTLFLLFYFRNAWAAFLVIIPLIVGTIWAFAWAAIVFGTLNFLTGFLGAILLGLGVDYGIHIVSRYFDLRAREHSVSQALMITILSAGKATFFAGLTTIVAMGTLAVSSFRAFFEFGIIAMGGMALIMLAYATVMPTCVLLMTRFFIRPPAPISVRLSRRLEQIFIGQNEPKSYDTKRIRRALYIGCIVLIGLILSMMAGGFRVVIERDFRALEITDTPAAKLDVVVNEILGESQTPGVVLAENIEHGEMIARELRRRQETQSQGYTIGSVLTINDVLPQEQSAKLDVLRRLNGELRKVPEANRTEELESFANEVAIILSEAPLEIGDLPESLRLPFTRLDADDGTAVLIFPSMSLIEANDILAYASALRNLPRPSFAPGEMLSSRRLDGISDSLLLADIIKYVQYDVSWMVIITVIGLWTITWVAFGRLRELILVQMALYLALIGAVTITSLFNIHFNLINLVVIPVWLGLAIDAGFHMYFLIRDEPGEIRPHISIALTVCAAFLTSMIGFGSLLISRHPGLYSLGQIAVSGLLIILIVTLVCQIIVVMYRQRGYGQKVAADNASTSAAVSRGDYVHT